MTAAIFPPIRCPAVKPAIYAGFVLSSVEDRAAIQYAMQFDFYLEIIQQAITKQINYLNNEFGEVYSINH